MTRQRSNTATIEPADGDDYVDREVPDAIADVLKTLAGVDEAPRTLGGFADLGETDLFSPGEAGLDEMLFTDESRHLVRLPDRTEHTYCFLDALVLAFVEDGPVEIRTRPPTSDEPTELVVSSERLQGAAGGSVVSFGFSSRLTTELSDVDGRSRAELLDVIHRHGCPKINLFEDKQAYEAWASEADAVTMPLTLPQAYALARDTVRTWET